MCVYFVCASLCLSALLKLQKFVSCSYSYFGSGQSVNAGYCEQTLAKSSNVLLSPTHHAFPAVS